MSLSQQLSKAVTEQVDKILSNYFQQVSSIHGVAVNDLASIWNGDKKSASKQPTTTSVVEPDNEELDVVALTKCSKAELSALCKKYGCPCSGNKQTLVDRLLAVAKGETSDSKKSNKRTPKTEKKTAKKMKQTKIGDIPVIKNLVDQLEQQPVVIRRNDFGNYEHPDTCFIFNQKTRKVKGKQCPDGTVEPLTDDDIQTCKQLKFEYEVPENLDTNTGLDNIQIEDLDDESDVVSEHESEATEFELEDEEDEEEEEEEEFEID